MEPFDEVFGVYLPDNEQGTENPTDQEDLSEGTSSPGSGGEAQDETSPPS